MGQVCARHNEYYEESCRWCEAPETDTVGLGAAPPARSIFGIDNPPSILAPPDSISLADFISRNNRLLRYLKAKAYDERLRLAMTPPNDGHGIFE